MNHSTRVRVATASLAVAATLGACSSEETSMTAEPFPPTVSSTSAETTVPRINVSDGSAPSAYPDRPGSEELSVDPARFLRGDGYYVTSPSGNVFCGLFPDGSPAGFVGCQAGTSVAPTDGPTCVNAGNSTYAVRVEQAGAVHFCTNQGIYAAGADTPVLNYGETITVGPVYCVSREEGMSCALTGSNAFLLSREQNYTYR